MEKESIIGEMFFDFFSLYDSKKYPDRIVITSCFVFETIIKHFNKIETTLHLPVKKSNGHIL